MYGMRPTACRVESSPTPLAFEVLSLLMIDENFEVVEISLTVVAPWSSENLLDIRMLSLGLPHDRSTAQLLWVRLRCSSNERVPA